jgi:hypothetical protein
MTSIKTPFHPLKIARFDSYDKANQAQNLWLTWKNQTKTKDWYEMVSPYTGKNVSKGPEGNAVLNKTKGFFYVIPPFLNHKFKLLTETIANNLESTGKNNNKTWEQSSLLVNQAEETAAKLLFKNPRFRTPATDRAFSTELDRLTHIYQTNQLKKKP